MARYLFFSMKPGVEVEEVAATLKAFAEQVDGTQVVAGFGPSLLRRLGAAINGLHPFPSYTGSGIDVPSTPFALWCWLRGEDRGVLLHGTRELRDTLSAGFKLEKVIDAFRYGPSLDLTGYEDGTENPQDAEAEAAGLVSGSGEGMDGSSFVAVQQWVHDLDVFQSLSQEQQDNTFGRRKSDNEEIEEAPVSAHVKRTAQESFEPQAFILRRSMPWANETEEGLVFVAFGKSLNAFEALLQRMIGLEDGVVDALFSFTHPVSGAYFWCPPMKDGHLDVQALNL